MEMTCFSKKAGKLEKQETKNVDISRHLFVSSLLQWVGIGVIAASGQQIWLKLYQGRLGAQARTMGMLSSGSSLLMIFITPAIGSICDSVGRKPLMILGPLLAGIGRFSVAFGGNGGQSIFSMSCYQVGWASFIIVGF